MKIEIMMIQTGQKVTKVEFSYQEATRLHVEMAIERQILGNRCPKIFFNFSMFLLPLVCSIL